MERKLFLLGLLRQHEMYGYQINELIDAHLGTSMDLTKPTAYRLLHEMAEEGWITYREEKVGKRPTRRIYSLNETGQVEFQEMLRQCLGQYDPVKHTGTLCLAFISTLPSEEVLPFLNKRRIQIEELLVTRKSEESHQGTFQLLIDHQIRHLETDLMWHTDLIALLESSDWEAKRDIVAHPSSQQT